MQSRGHSRPPWPHLVLRSNHLWGFSGWPVRRASTQESENERVAASPESHRLGYCDARSFRRAPGGGSFQRACPVWRSDGNTFLSGFRPSLNASWRPKYRNAWRRTVMPAGSSPSKSLSNNGHWPSTERKWASTPCDGPGKDLTQAFPWLGVTYCLHFIILSINLHSSDRSSARSGRRFLADCPAGGGV